MAVPGRARRRAPGAPTPTLPAGGRRRATRGDVKEQAILATAEQLLRQRPLSAITVDELARGAGITRPTFYFYFDSREAVLRSLAAGVAQRMYEATTSWLRRTDEAPLAAIRRSVAANLEVWREHGPVLRAMVRARESDPVMAAFWEDLASRFAGAVAAQIERERAAGLAPPGPPAADLARMLVAMTERVNYDGSLTQHSARSERAFVDTLSTILLRSIYGPDSPVTATT
jgi:TetR/AcrR family transcriptional regulator, ethionamide resistance regulator